MDESEGEPSCNSTALYFDHWRDLPDIIAALFVHAVVGEVHECVLDVLWSPVILNCGKSVKEQGLFTQEEKGGEKSFYVIQLFPYISMCRNIHICKTLDYK